MTSAGSGKSNKVWRLPYADSVTLQRCQIVNFPIRLDGDFAFLHQQRFHIRHRLRGRFGSITGIQSVNGDFRGLDRLNCLVVSAKTLRPE
jgi:hypothetical protein